MTKAAKPRPPVRRAIGSAAIAVALLCSTAMAQAADPDAAKIRALQKQIDKRDAVIKDLLRRVERLEKQAGGRRAAAVKAQAAPAARAPAGEGTPPPAEQPAAAAGPATERREAAQNAPAEPSAAPGQFSVSPEAAQRALERALVQTGALLLPPGQAEIVPSLTYQYDQLSRPAQIALNADGTVFVTENVLRSTTAEAGLLGRIGLPWDSQLEIGVPYAYKNLTTATRVLGTGVGESSIDAFGIGDPSVTLTKQITKEGEWLPSLFASGSWNAQFGQTDHGIPLGAGFHEFAVGLTATKRQDPLVFTGSFSYLTALEHNHITPGDQIGSSLGMLFAVSPETSLRVAQQVTFADKIRASGRLIPGSQQVLGSFTFGILSILGPGLVVDLSAAVGETSDAPDLTVRLGFPIRLN